MVEAEAANGTAALSAVEVTALTEPLRAVQRTGSWLYACSNCTSGDASLLPLALTGHCRDCGLLMRSAQDAFKVRQ